MAKIPTAIEILANDTIRAELRRAYNESNVSGRMPIEQGGFILRDLNTSELSVACLPAGERDSIRYPICRDGRFDGREILGAFHTHPNAGPEWQHEPSPQDIRLSIDYPATMGSHQFVSRETIYHVDPVGDVTVVGSTARWLELNIKETDA